ncbi:MAG: NADH-quinone oxidoreductase subunit L [Dehalococcoidia bacterium]|nr:NADH-quinone oxidoreductase subunit L [Dehalococcoidia bacterium]
MPPEVALAIFLLPFLSFVVIAFVIRPFLNNRPQLSGYVTIASIGISLLLSLWVLVEVIKSPGHELSMPDYQWLAIGDTAIHIGVTLDALAAVMLIVVTSVSLLVQVYSQGYMRGDPGYPRYFAFMSLFTCSMLGLVLADNLLFLYLFWEGVGLCSYLLIGFWFHKPEAARAATKAFVVTRLGDFGFLAAILFLYAKTGTFDIAELYVLAPALLSATALTWAAIGVFSGAVGKSAQFPLHTWLPDAMEGPTPVSALIHAATMVAAGVYLVARMFPVFASSTEAITTVAIIGGFTAIFAASMGLVMNDIKRVLAYSTISQLGYMMLGLGAVGVAVAGGVLEPEHGLMLGVAVGIFHLFNHAFFKALLFLGAGSVNHATGTFDMREMGGLRKAMPWTYLTFLIASLSIAGIWPLSGFWSKEGILAHAWESTPILFYLAMITVFMTAFYMFRVVFLTFGGEYRGQSEGSHGLHESPLVMIAPMVLLAILSVVSGWLPISELLGGESHSFFGALASPLAWASLILAGLGILLAYAIYSKKWLSAESLRQRFAPLYTLFSRKYWLDELYESVFVVRILIDGLFAAFHWFDDRVVDGVVNGVAGGTVAAGRGIRRAQTGQLQAYGLAIFIGILVIVACLFIFD